MCIFTEAIPLGDTKLLEHDLANVLNQLPEDAFNELFTAGEWGFLFKYFLTDTSEYIVCKIFLKNLVLSVFRELFINLLVPSVRRNLRARLKKKICEPKIDNHVEANSEEYT